MNSIKSYSIILLTSAICTVNTWAQVTYAEHIAPIIYNHCSSCHRPGEIGPMALTNYDEVKAWGQTIKYVTEQKIMPPWKADPAYSRFLDENYLDDEKIALIQAWVSEGMIRGNSALEPAFPEFPEGSLLGTPDLVLSFAQSYTHKGNGNDEYRYFVLPTGLSENKKLKAIELRPGNTKVVHHALFFADESGKARAYDAQTPEYGFSAYDNPDFNVFEVINRAQYPGYVPGQKPRYFPDGLGQDMKAGSDLIIQMHYAPSAVDEIDSSTVNLFFADESETVNRIVKDYIMLPFNLVTGASSFFIAPNTEKTFHGTYTLPIDASLIGIFPHMHLLGRNWEVYIQNIDGSRQNLIKINDWDFNWQGGYYFDRYKIAKKGSTIHAFAKYDNTLNNPFNPNNPPKFVTWGEGTADEMYYLPLLYVPYKSGDENIIFGEGVSSTQDSANSQKDDIITARVSPNPALEGQDQVTIAFDMPRGLPIRIDIIDAQGRVVRELREWTYFGQGRHVIHWQIGDTAQGMYYVRFASKYHTASYPVQLMGR